MLRDSARVADDESVSAWGSGGDADRGWEQIDRSLRRIATKRAALDAHEARWLREAERVRIWEPLGMVNMIDYLERVLGYAPRTGQQRMQVARALASLPAMTEALAEGELSFSAVRELVRVATPSTEAAWRAHVGGMNLRQIEEAVAGRKPGDVPTDPQLPELRTHTVTLELSDPVFALWRQAGLALAEQLAHSLDDDELGTALATAVLERGAADGERDHIGRATYQIALTVCERCDQAWQEGAGVQFPVDAARLAQARCDAQHLGSLDGKGPARAHQDVPPSVDRFVRRRDGNRCQTPGCRSALGLELHHIVHRADGGTHDPSNLSLRCFSCHAAHHRGALTITGTAPDQIVTTRQHAPAQNARPDRSHVAPVGENLRAHVSAPSTAQVASPPASRFEQIALRTQARDALVGMGWKPAIASVAVDAARAHGHAGSSLEILIREALRRCPMPRTR